MRRLGWHDASPLLANDVFFYLPIDKQADDFRYSVLRPATKDKLHHPTPWIFAGVPNMDFPVGPPSRYKKTRADYDVDDLYIANNLIVMSAPAKTAEGRPPRSGPYERAQLREALRTAYTAFRGAVRLARRKLAYHRAAEQAETATSHDWGCGGTLGGHPTAMAAVQIAAARAAGVTELVYHTSLWDRQLQQTPDAIGRHVREAEEILRECWPGADAETEALLAHLESKKMQWLEPEDAWSELD
ncbi:hypothetical protein HK405_012509 [Cladochytrium tenue]|nr:hypothetical protein HK405_012509 [Cladochytrium tenue]